MNILKKIWFYKNSGKKSSPLGQPNQNKEDPVLLTLFMRDYERAMFMRDYEKSNISHAP